MPNGLTVAAVHLRVSALNEFQYRSNFFLQVLQSLIQVVSGLVVVALVYDKTSQLNGWDRSELLAAVGVFTIVGGLVRAFIEPAILQLMDDVQEGTFDFVLTRPVDPLLLVSVRRLNVWQLADVVVGAIIVVVAAADLPASFGPAAAAVFVALLGSAALIAHSMWLAVACCAFWVVRLPYMQNLFHYVGRSAQYPISIYPAWLRIGLTVVVPLGIAVTAPSEAVTSRLGAATVAVVAAVTIGTVVLSRALWRRGLRRYSGASS